MSGRIQWNMNFLILIHTRLSELTKLTRGITTQEKRLIIDCVYKTNKLPMSLVSRLGGKRCEGFVVVDDKIIKKEKPASSASSHGQVKIERRGKQAVEKPRFNKKRKIEKKEMEVEKISRKEELFEDMRKKEVSNVDPNRSRQDDDEIDYFI
eukprot:g34262.t1